MTHSFKDKKQNIIKVFECQYKRRQCESCNTKAEFFVVNSDCDNQQFLFFCEFCYRNLHQDENGNAKDKNHMAYWYDKEEILT